MTHDGNAICRTLNTSHHRMLAVLRYRMVAYCPLLLFVTRVCTHFAASSMSLCAVVSLQYSNVAAFIMHSEPRNTDEHYCTRSNTAPSSIQIRILEIDFERAESCIATSDSTDELVIKTVNGK